jgi:hypothetical protein
MNQIATVRVFFAHQARIADIEIGPRVRKYLNQLKRVDGVYLAATRADYLALRPYEYCIHHTIPSE